MNESIEQVVARTIDRVTRMSEGMSTEFKARCFVSAIAGVLSVYGSKSLGDRLMAEILGHQPEREASHDQ